MLTGNDVFIVTMFNAMVKACATKWGKVEVVVLNTAVEMIKDEVKNRTEEEALAEQLHIMQMVSEVGSDAFVSFATELYQRMHNMPVTK